MIYFIIGKPASGKSTFIKNKLITKHENFKLYDDRNFLLKHALNNKYSDMIQLTDETNFIIKKIELLDNVLSEIANCLLDRTEKYSFVEFSRNNYSYCFDVIFNTIINRNSCKIIYLNTPFSICLNRNNHRKHKVPIEEMINYFRNDDIYKVTQNYEIDFINNNVEII
ncbi:MAG: hypothetical protein H6Q18_392 [Bacteroidetes bacterium]|nr:hypothetical protein [Bacteroidota bacterium]